MEIRHVRYFLAVAETLNFRRAAQNLCISQPPLSLQIKQLEEELGVALFQRDKHRVALTDAGHTFRDYAEQIIKTVAEAKDAIAKRHHQIVGDLHVGFTQSSGFLPFVSATISKFRTEYPAVRLRLSPMSSLDQIEAILTDKLDLAVVRLPHGKVDRRLVAIELLNDRLALAVPEDNELGKTQPVTIADLAETNMLCMPVDNGTGLRHIVEQLCKAAGFVPNIIQEASALPSLVGLVGSGLGVAIVPYSMRFLGFPHVRYLELDAVSARSPVYLLHRVDKANAADLAFKHMLQSHAQSYDGKALS